MSSTGATCPVDALLLLAHSAALLLAADVSLFGALVARLEFCGLLVPPVLPADLLRAAPRITPPLPTLLLQTLPVAQAEWADRVGRQSGQSATAVMGAQCVRRRRVCP